jgi:hypothetical protein
MRLRLIVTGLLLPLLVMGCSDEPKPAPVVADQTRAASDAIGVLRQLVTEQNYAAMGFGSLAEVKEAQVGAPLAVSNVGLEALRGYATGSDPATLLTPSAETVYPVTVGGTVKSSITLVKSERGYAASSFGNAGIAQAIARVRGEAGPDAFIVRVPALQVWFIGRRGERGLMLTPIAADPRLQVESGRPVPADAVFAQLVPLARAYNGLPL